MKQAFGPFREKSLSDFQVLGESHQSAIEAVERYTKDLDNARFRGRGLTFLGPTGVGKTLLASITLNEAQQRGYRVEAIELSTYVRLHKDLFSLHSLIKAGHDEVIDEYVKLRQHVRLIQGISKRSADWVLFDDVGREYPSDSGWSQGEFFDTLRSRWNRNLPTLLTTNFPMADLERRYSEGLTSLLQEATDIILVTGDDYRWRTAS